MTEQEHALRLVSFDLCPFVQRSVIALEEKGAEYSVEYIDLADKPDWFLAISPHGKVPALRVGDTTLFESTVILEYLDETLSPRLAPSDPLQRARDRAWFTATDGLFGGTYRAMVAGDEQALSAAVEEMQKSLALLEGEIEGPLWRGQRFVAMDAVAAPGLQRARWLDELRPDLKIFAGYPKCDTWERTLSTRPSVEASLVANIRTRFVAYLRKHDAAALSAP